MGSPPGERTKISGAQQWESANALGRLKGGGSIYCLPILATTKSCTAGITCVHLGGGRVCSSWSSVELDQCDYFIRPKATKDDHLLEHSKLVPLPREVVCVGVYTVVILLPLIHHTTKCHPDALEPGERWKDRESMCTGHCGLNQSTSVILTRLDWCVVVFPSYVYMYTLIARGYYDSYHKIHNGSLLTSQGHQDGTVHPRISVGARRQGFCEGYPALLHQSAGTSTRIPPTHGRVSGGWRTVRMKTAAVNVCENVWQSVALEHRLRLLVKLSAPEKYSSLWLQQFRNYR